MRRKLLLEYLREVARELLRAGILHAHAGANPIDILRQKPSEMIGMMVRDLKDAGFSVGQEILGGAVQGFLGAVFRSRR